MKMFYVNLFLVSCFALSNCAITYQLYTRMNPNSGQPLVYMNTESIMKSHFNKAKKNKLLIHGYAQNGRSDFNKEVKNALLKHDDYNVIVSDWSTSSGGSYNVARARSVLIARSIANFIDWLRLDEGFIHLVAFDLGCHIAGVAGKYVKNGRIDKITCNDAARRGYNLYQSMNRLAASDARFVEVMHSNGGKLGWHGVLGDSDLYINDGKTQPNCTTDWCSHEVSWKIYRDFLHGMIYPANICESLAELDGKGCGLLEGELNENTGIIQLITTNGPVFRLNTSEINAD